MSSTEHAAPAAGRLVLIGGREDKRGNRAILRRIVEINDARCVVVIPSASAYPRPLSSTYRKAFEALGVDRVEIVDVRKRREAELGLGVEVVEEADAVFFTGGDQVKLTRALAGTPLMHAIWSRFRDGATVAGTSAGAAAAGEVMIYDGDGRGFRKGSVGMSRGLGLLSGGIVVDTHFLARGRLARLAQVLSADARLRGLGLAEDTGVVITPDRRCEVVGAGHVTVLSAGDLETSTYQDAGRGEQLTMDGFRLGFLAPGSVFDLEAWRVCPAPAVLEREPQPVSS